MQPQTLNLKSTHRDIFYVNDASVRLGLGPRGFRADGLGFQDFEVSFATVASGPCRNQLCAA